MPLASASYLLTGGGILPSWTAADTSMRCRADRPGAETALFRRPGRAR
jgi:hypothetical protein